MMETYGASLLISLAGYGVMAAAYFGWGTVFSRFLKIDLAGWERIFSLIWLGWCGSLFLLQLCNFVVPIDAWVSGPFFIFGFVFWILALRGTGGPRRFFPNLPAVNGIFLGLFAVWAASWAMLAPTNYDSGLYHFNSIRWINEYPIVQGIGNLHARLAFNQSFFTYAASLNLYPYFSHGHSLANSFLALLLIAECLFTIVNSNADGRKGRYPVDISAFLASNCILVAVIFVVTYSISSPTPDIAAIAIQMVLFMYFARHLAGCDERERGFSRSGVILVLAVTALTIKLSMLAYAAVIAMITIGLLWRNGIFRDSAFLRRSVSLSLLLLLMFGCWALKAYLQSGYPLFPSTFAGIGFDWSVPHSQAVSESRWIYSWARQPGVNPDIVLNSWNWFKPWLANILGRSATIVYPLSVSLFAIAVWVLLARIKSFKFTSATDKVFILLPVPIVSGMVFWFFTAPDPRFAGALFMLLPPSVLYPLLKFTASKVRIDGTFLIIIFTIVANGSLSLWFVDNAPHVVRIPAQGYASVPAAALKIQTTLSGLQLLTPVEGDQCWDSELPCTPYFNKDLHLRGSTLRSGFSVL